MTARPTNKHVALPFALYRRVLRVAEARGTSVAAIVTAAVTAALDAPIRRDHD